MAEIRLRRDGIESPHGSLDEIRKLLRVGHATAADEIWRDGRWLPLGQVPELRALATGGGDPWAAWAETENIDADVVVRDYTARAPAELPRRDATPVARPTVTRRPADPLSVPEINTTGGGGLPQVITWPDRDEPSSAPPNLARAVTPDPGAQAPAVPPAPTAAGTRVPPAFGGEVVELPRPARRREREVAPVRREGREATRAAGRISRLLLLGVSLLVLATTLYGLVRLSSLPGAAGPGPIVPGGAGAPEPNPVEAADARYVAMEEELRAADLGRPRPVTERPHLGDALLVELQHLGVAVADVQANVTRWTGRRRDDPAAAEIHVVLRGGGNPERDVGAVALVVGRYMQAYALDVPILDLRWRGREEDRLLALPASRCEDFARRRLPLSRLLALVTSPRAPPAAAPAPSGGSPRGSADPGSQDGSSAPG
jgi:hypothetical protein